MEQTLTPEQLTQLARLNTDYVVRAQCLASLPVTVEPNGDIAYDENDVDVFGDDERYEVNLRATGEHIALLETTQLANDLILDLAAKYAELLYDTDTFHAYLLAHENDLSA